MIYAVIGTHAGLREKAHKELAMLGSSSHHIYSEQVGELEQLVDAVSLFGEAVIVTCIQLGDVTSSKSTLVSLLPQMEASKNIFIIDELFADVHLFNKVSKLAKKTYDAREEKVRDTSVFKLCDSFVVRDKKQAWLDFITLSEKGEAGEAIQGALWWKFQTVWQATRGGRKTAFTLTECERIGYELVKSTILAHRGERDLMVELERIILSL